MDNEPLKNILKTVLGDAPDPENNGNYTGYKLNKNQTMMDFNNLPFNPGYDNGGAMSDRTIDNNIVHKGF
jgi:hypothetical protein